MAPEASKPTDRTASTEDTANTDAVVEDEAAAEKSDDAKQAGQQRAAAAKKVEKDPAAARMIKALENERRGYVSRKDAKDRVAQVDAQLKIWKARA
jgi:hypothetical protein